MLTDLKKYLSDGLGKINWPTEDEDEDTDVSLEDTCRITGFLRTFIENGKYVLNSSSGYLTESL